MAMGIREFGNATAASLGTSGAVSVPCERNALPQLEFHFLWKRHGEGSDKSFGRHPRHSTDTDSTEPGGNCRSCCCHRTEQKLPIFIRKGQAGNHELWENLPGLPRPRRTQRTSPRGHKSDILASLKPWVGDSEFDVTESEETQPEAAERDVLGLFKIP